MGGVQIQVEARELRPDAQADVGLQVGAGRTVDRLEGRPCIEEAVCGFPYRFTPDEGVAVGLGGVLGAVVGRGTEGKAPGVRAIVGKDVLLLGILGQGRGGDGRQQNGGESGSDHGAPDAKRSVGFLDEGGRFGELRRGLTEFRR